MHERDENTLENKMRKSKNNELNLIIGRELKYAYDYLTMDFSLY